MLDEDNLKVVYILNVGKDRDGMNVYQFLLSEDEEDVMTEAWGEIPACNCQPESLLIDESQYSHICTLKTTINFMLAQENCCFSMQDCKDGAYALGIEDISTYDEYPEEGRLIIGYGESLDTIREGFAARNIVLSDVEEVRKG